MIPVVIDGTYPDNCPPALRFEVTPDGTVTDRPVTILGPDLRETADGKQLGLAKIVAGLLGLSTDDIVRRAERDARRRMRRWVAGLSTVVVSLAGLSVWPRTNIRATSRHKAAHRVDVAKDAMKSMAGGVDGCSTIDTIARGTRFCQYK